MESLAEKITEYCVYKEIISIEEKAWLKYGIEKRLSTSIGTIPLTILALYLTNIPATVSFLFAFKQLRQRVNGYHSKTEIGCLCISLLLEFLFLSVIYQHINLTTSLGVNVICSSLIFTLAPYDHPNMNFSKAELFILRKSSKKAAVLITLLSMISYLISLSSIAKGLTTGMAMAAFMLCLAYYTDWRKTK